MKYHQPKQLDKGKNGNKLKDSEFGSSMFLELKKDSSLKKKSNNRDMK